MICRECGVSMGRVERSDRLDQFVCRECGREVFREPREKAKEHLARIREQLAQVDPPKRKADDE